MIVAMILAGGVGARFGADRPKQFVEVLEKPVIAYTIDIFEQYSNVDLIEVVCHKEWREYLQSVIHKYKFKKIKWIVDGGDTFQQSVINGMNYLKDKINEKDYVLIQYAASPFTSNEIIDDVIKVMKKNKSSVTMIPCYQLMGSNDGEKSNKWVNRDQYVQIASPSGFSFGYLCDIYERAVNNNLLNKVDPHTTSIMYALGDPLYRAYGNQTNIKITTKEDLDLFEGYILMKQKKRILKENGE